MSIQNYNTYLPNYIDNKIAVLNNTIQGQLLTKQNIINTRSRKIINVEKKFRKKKRKN